MKNLAQTPNLQILHIVHILHSACLVIIYNDIHIEFSVKLDRVVLFMEAQLPWECVQAFGGKLDSVYKKSNCDS